MSTGIPVAETFMGKGALDCDDPRAVGTVGLHERDYTLAGFEEADVVIAVGYDLVEHAPEHWNPRRDKRIVVIDTLPAEIDAYFTPDIELVGDLYHMLHATGRRVPPLAAVAPTARVVSTARGRDGKVASRSGRRALPDATAARAVGAAAGAPAKRRALRHALDLDCVCPRMRRVGSPDVVSHPVAR